MNKSTWEAKVAGMALLALVGFVPWAGAADEPQRLVFVGDSITDGHTYPLLVRQALAEAKKPVPVCINAGLAGDTAAGIHKRVERDVLSRKPTLVLLSVGVNDALHKLKPAEFEADVKAIADELQAKKVPLLVLTATPLGPKHAEEDKALADLNAVLRRVAKDHGATVAEVNEKMRATGDLKPLLEDDQVHLTFEGYRVMARAVLDALGHKDVPVPEKLTLEPLPGIVSEWKVRAAPKDAALDDKAVADLKPDGSWTTYPLPEKDAAAHWWFDQERQRGFAVSLEKKVGAAKRYQAVAVVEADKPRQAFLNTGAQLEGVWLNGKRVYKSEGWTGWHAGKERVPVKLEAGKNTLVIETGGAFFLSLTDAEE
jgi:lysophospholipase L1-like esterase